MVGCGKNTFNRTDSKNDNSNQFQEDSEMNKHSYTDSENSINDSRVNEQIVTTNENADDNNDIKATTSEKINKLPDSISVPPNASYCQYDQEGTYCFYDKHDNLIERYHEGYDTEKLSCQYEYNDDGTIAVQTMQNVFGTETFLFTYNLDKTLLRQKEQGEDGYTQFEYDEHGQVILRYFIRESDGVCMVKTEYENIYENGKLIVQREKGNSQLATETAYEYDKNGNISREILKSVYMNEVIQDTKYSYNEDGKIKTEERLYPDTGTFIFEYEYVYF